MNDGKSELVVPPELRRAGSDHLEALFETLPPSARDRIGRIAHRRHYGAGEVLANEGDDIIEVGYVLEGTLGLTKVLSDGRTHIVGLLVPTDMYGKLFNGRSPFRIEALTDTVVFSFDRAPFESILLDHPDVERLFLVEILDELDAAREWIILMGARKAVERVAAFLLILGRRNTGRLREGKSTRPKIVNLLVRRADLARYLGMRAETLSRALHELADGGIIRLLDSDHLEILDIPGLLEMAGQDPEDGGDS